MKSEIKITDFTFQSAGYGHYKVTYQSAKTLKSWATVTNNMQLIDATKNEDSPKKVNLEKLKRICKGN